MIIVSERYGCFFVAIFIKKNYGYQIKIWSSNHKICSSGMLNERKYHVHQKQYNVYQKKNMLIKKNMFNKLKREIQ